MNNWIYKLERRYGRFALPNLMLYITGTMLVVFLLTYFTGYNIGAVLDLRRSAVLSGQVWRLISFVFVPSSSGVLGTLLYLYFNYAIGTALEDAWGSFKFTFYYLCGALSAILTMFLLGYGTSYYLNLTMFLAYAYLFPNQEFLLFFVLPIKAKYIALIDWLLIIAAFIQGPWSGRLGIVLALANFFLFFGGGFLRQIRAQIGWWKTRRNFRRKNRDDIHYY